MGFCEWVYVAVRCEVWVGLCCRRGVCVWVRFTMAVHLDQQPHRFLDHLSCANLLCGSEILSESRFMVVV
jgi:hypothetical protein